MQAGVLRLLEGNNKGHKTNTHTHTPWLAVRCKPRETDWERFSTNIRKYSEKQLTINGKQIREKEIFLSFQGYEVSLQITLYNFNSVFHVYF